MEHLDLPPDTHSVAGNQYLLLAGLESPSEPTTLTPGLTLLPVPTLGDDLNDVHFENGDLVEILAFVNEPFCELESAMDSAIRPGRDTQGRALLASQLLTLINFPTQFPVAVSQKSWRTIADDRSAYGKQLRQWIQSRLGAAVGRVEPDSDELARLMEEAEEAIGPLRSARIITRARPRFAGASQGSFGESDAKEMRDLFPAFNELAGTDAAFSFALGAADDWRWAVDERAAIARLWSGIEAIAGVDTETTWRTAARVACLTCERGPQRHDWFKRVKRLYVQRSRAVHGSQVKGTFQGPLDESFDVLRRMLLAVVRRGKVPSGEEYNQLLFE